MKRQITTGYVFTPTASPPTIDLSAITGASLGALLAIIDVTTGQLLYAAGTAGYASKGYSAANVLSLQASTTGCASTDVLQIILDDGANPALDASVQALLTQLKATLTVAGTVTATGGMLDATGQSILTALKAQVNLADALVVDGSGVYWVRRETDNEGTITVVFETLAGVTGTPSGTLSPATGVSRVPETAFYDVTVAGSATAVGDIIARTVIYDTVAASSVATLWQNVTQGTTITAATAGTYVESTKDVTIAASALPTNASQEAGGNLAALVAALGSKTDAVAASPGATASLIALVRLLATYGSTTAGAVSGGKVLTAPQSGAPSVTTSGTVSAAGSAVTLAVDGYNAASIQVLGTWSGALTFQGSPDGGTTYYPVSAIPMSGGASAGTATGNGWWELSIGGFTHLQVVAATALTSGSSTVALRATTGTKSLRVGTAAQNPLLTTGTAVALTDRSGTTSATAGTATTPFATNAGRQFARITNLASGTSTATIYVYDKASGTPTTSNSVPLAPGQSITWDAKVPSGPISVFSTGVSIAFEAAEG